MRTAEQSQTNDKPMSGVLLTSLTHIEINYDNLYNCLLCRTTQGT